MISPLMAGPLFTPRLMLRRFEAEDADTLFAILGDAEAMRYWSTLPHTSLSQTREFVTRTMAACTSGEADDFAVIREGALIGKAGLWKGDELGFIFSRAVWGTGVAREAVEAVLAQAFARGVMVVNADVDPRNSRCLALLAKLGFVETGRAARTYQLGDEWADSVYFALTNSQSGG
jgi:RimJ/RimL family protein N-acetyltransferase